MAARFYARSACLLVQQESNFSKPERSLWHFDTLNAGGINVGIRKRQCGNADEGRRGLDLPKKLPCHLTLLTAEVFDEAEATRQLNLLAIDDDGRFIGGSSSGDQNKSAEVRLELTKRTAISFVFPEYRVVLSIGLAESLFVVSPTSGRIAFDLVPSYIETLLEQLVAPIRLDGHIHFEPVIHLSVVATTPTRTFRCLVQGRVVNRDTHHQVAKHISAQLYALVQRDSFRNADGNFADSWRCGNSINQVRFVSPLLTLARD